MALLAFFALTTFMDIRFLVTGDAGLRCVPIGFVSGVALCAADVFVFAFQTKIGMHMLKIGGVELQNIGIATLVFRMAQAAFTVGNPWAATMKSRVGANIFTHRGMTIQTKLNFAFGIAFAMTFFAFAFMFGVSFT